ncbi:HAD family hydrolase [Pontixanthobacter aestiaquae]|uniref:HAD family hydrolase n=1 Tax=Pontixanthobacter aestiaquae TaxID=1509367 RepID=A0A844Z572_9SPHN|nr:HAD family hydrolase [Pontixanthobacter aestiaquae]MDN3647091.1 HAD family hydrolase [Pontixanthobacter aestiaquae]MXO81933.1 HAD family hydrolase [Pontixanthobacter aestiaquae]
MNRPLLISDCDEVLLHMVAPFRDWLAENEGVEFRMAGNNFANSMRWQDSGKFVGEKDIWRLLGSFFDTEMYRQKPIEGAISGINIIAENADVVILTNLNDARQQMRAEQLAEHGVHARVFTNQGPKGPALANIIAEYQPERAIFIDDLPQHHESVSEVMPDVKRLHLCGEPMLAPLIDCAHEAGHAHARIDNWFEALPWLQKELHGETV